MTSMGRLYYCIASRSLMAVMLTAIVLVKDDEDSPKAVRL